ncbi:MAG: heparan-alpha-glucosaminide N-acetyltransferase domain-containing protein, partial [Bacteroidota bacterium]
MNRIKESVRYWEIDALRGIAILGMVIVHTIAIELYWLDIDIFTYPSLSVYLPRIGVSVFFTLMGVSLYIGACRGRYPSLVAALKRSGVLFFSGMLATLATCMLD